MGRITSLQNDIGHLQRTLATKNDRIADLEKQVKALTKERDDAREKIAQLLAPQAA